MAQFINSANALLLTAVWPQLLHICKKNLKFLRGPKNHSNAMVTCPVAWEALSHPISTNIRGHLVSQGSPLVHLQTDNGLAGSQVAGQFSDLGFTTQPQFSDPILFAVGIDLVQLEALPGLLLSSSASLSWSSSILHRISSITIIISTNNITVYMRCSCVSDKKCTMGYWQSCRRKN